MPAVPVGKQLVGFWAKTAGCGNMEPDSPAASQVFTVPKPPSPIQSSAFRGGGFRAGSPRRGWWLNQSSPIYSHPGRRLGGTPFSPHDPPFPS